MAHMDARLEAIAKTCVRVVRGILLATALLAFMDSAAPAQSSGSASDFLQPSDDPFARSPPSASTTGAAATTSAGAPTRGAAPAGSHQDYQSATNPLAGATAGSASVAAPARQQPYEAEVFQAHLADGNSAPLYGSQLFGGAFAGTRPSDRPDYVIQPGDVVVVNLYGAVNSGGNQTVDTQGNIFVVGIGPVHVSGVPSNQLQGVVASAVGRVFTGSVRIYTAISNAGTIGVFVTGDVKRPGRYVGAAQDNVLYFLNLAQGIGPSGTYRAVTVRRDGQTVSPSRKRKGCTSPLVRKS